MKRLAILVSTSLVIGIPLLHGCEKLNRIKTEQVSTTTESQPQSNWVEEFDRIEKETEQERLESDIEWAFYSLATTEVGYEVGKQMIIDCLVDVHGWDRELVSEVIDNIDWGWEYNCLVTYRKLLKEGHREDVIVAMLRGAQFTESEIQYAIDNH